MVAALCTAPARRRPIRLSIANETIARLTRPPDALDGDLRRPQERPSHSRKNLPSIY
jgi:hypothetical protein